VSIIGAAGGGAVSVIGICAADGGVFAVFIAISIALGAAELGACAISGAGALSCTAGASRRARGAELRAGRRFFTGASAWGVDSEPVATVVAGVSLGSVVIATVADATVADESLEGGVASAVTSAEGAAMSPFKPALSVGALGSAEGSSLVEAVSVGTASVAASFEAPSSTTGSSSSGLLLEEEQAARLNPRTRVTDCVNAEFIFI
jgi:hypothetical protein